MNIETQIPTQSSLPNWLGQPYFPISQFYHQQFGQKVQKVAVSVADDCPNRMGLKGMKTCIFCDEWGSAAYADAKDRDLNAQIELLKKLHAKKFKAKAFLVYFQSYTNTFIGIKAQRANFEVALAHDDVKGLVVGTRPDCLSQAVLEMWNEYAQKTFMSVELGVQSFFDHHLEFIRRGHTGQQSLDAIKTITEKTKNVNLGIHLIFGMPNETDEEVIQTAKLINTLPLHNVKLHNLHVLSNTPLADLYHEKKFTPIELDSYANRVSLFLQHLRSDIAVHRLCATASRWDELVAPQWTRHKSEINNFILKNMKDHGAYQGRLSENAPSVNNSESLLAN